MRLIASDLVDNGTPEGSQTVHIVKPLISLGLREPGKANKIMTEPSSSISTPGWTIHGDELRKIR